MENAKLRDDLAKLRESIKLNDGENKGRDELLRQFYSMQEELSRKREESIQLRTVLASPNKPNASPSQNGENDDDIGMVLQTQKQVRRGVFAINLPRLAILKVLYEFFTLGFATVGERTAGI